MHVSVPFSILKSLAAPGCKVTPQAFAERFFGPTARKVSTTAPVAAQ
jgi:hypothetical protein